jgi:hypothetical protein
METKELKSRYELKGLLKAQSELLKKSSLEIRKTQKEGKYAGKLQSQHQSDKRVHRLFHIAYSMLRGKTYEQIEQRVHKGNELTNYDFKQIEEIKNEYSKPVENVRLSA